MRSPSAARLLACFLLMTCAGCSTLQRLFRQRLLIRFIARRLTAGLPARQPGVDGRRFGKQSTQGVGVTRGSIGQPAPGQREVDAVLVQQREPVFGQRGVALHVGGLLQFKLPDDAPNDFMRKMMAEFRSHRDFKPPWNRRLKLPINKNPVHAWVEDDDIDAMTVRRTLKELGASNPLDRAIDGERAAHAGSGRAALWKRQHRISPAHGAASAHA